MMKQNFSEYFKLLPEMRLLLELVSPWGWDAGRVEWLARQVCWRQFATLALEHHIAPLVYFCAAGKAVLPETVETQFKREFIHSQQTQLLYTRELLQLADKLSATGQGFLVLKGIPSAQRLYGNVALRYTHDIDILLFKRADTGLVHDLAGLGWQMTVKKYDTARLQYLLGNARHVVFKKPGGLYLETHNPDNNWSLSADFGKNYCGVEYSLSGKTIKVMPEIDAFLFSCVHGCHHGFSSLRWLCDVAWFAAKAEKWRAITDRAREIHAENFLAATMLLLEQLFGMVAPGEISGLRNKKVRLLAWICVRAMTIGTSFTRNPHRPDNWLLGKFLAVNSYSVKKVILIHFKPIDWDLRHFPLPENARWLYVPLRPLLWLYRLALRLLGKRIEI